MEPSEELFIRPVKGVGTDDQVEMLITPMKGFITGELCSGYEIHFNIPMNPCWVKGVLTDALYNAVFIVVEDADL